MSTMINKDNDNDFDDVYVTQEDQDREIFIWLLLMLYVWIIISLLICSFLNVINVCYFILLTKTWLWSNSTYFFIHDLTKSTRRSTILRFLHVGERILPTIDINVYGTSMINIRSFSNYLRVVAHKKFFYHNIILELGTP